MVFRSHLSIQRRSCTLKHPRLTARSKQGNDSSPRSKMPPNQMVVCAGGHTFSMDMVCVSKSLFELLPHFIDDCICLYQFTIQFGRGCVRDAQWLVCITQSPSSSWVLKRGSASLKEATNRPIDRGTGIRMSSCGLRVWKCKRSKRCISNAYEGYGRSSR